MASARIKMNLRSNGGRKRNEEPDGKSSKSNQQKRVPISKTSTEELPSASPVRLPKRRTGRPNSTKAVDIDDSRNGTDCISEAPNMVPTAKTSTEDPPRAVRVRLPKRRGVRPKSPKAVDSEDGEGSKTSGSKTVVDKRLPPVRAKPPRSTEDASDDSGDEEDSQTFVEKPSSAVNMRCRPKSNKTVDIYDTEIGEGSMTSVEKPPTVVDKRLPTVSAEPLKSTEDAKSDDSGDEACTNEATADSEDVKHSVAVNITVDSSTSSELWEPFASVAEHEVKSIVATCEYGYRFKTANSVTRGTVRYYNCRRIKVKSHSQCTRKLMVFIPNDSTVNCSINMKGVHSCITAKPEDLAKIPLGRKELEDVDSMLRSGIPLKDVKKHLKANNQQVSKNRINYAVQRASQAMFSCGTLSLGELAEWAKAKSVTPSEYDAAFIIGYDIDEDNNRFRLVYSSRKLLSLFKTLHVLSADCTFKTTLQGYPLMVVCLIDHMRHAHPVAFATITKQEEADYKFVFAAIVDQLTRFGIRCTVEAFVSDGEIALKKAVRSVFGEDVMLVNCFFHVVQNIKKHMMKNKSIPPESKEQILKDVGRIQIAPTVQHFETACELFRQKYETFPDFVHFFRKYASDDFYRNWFEGFLPGYPATNNSLEALNRAIKEEHLLRAREQFGTFKHRILNVVESYGRQDRKIYEERMYSLEDERKAFDFFKANKRTRNVDDYSERQLYVYVPGGQSNEVTGRDIEMFNNPSRRSLQHYLDELEAVHRVTITDQRWTSWNCTCRWFFKNNTCYHVVVAAVTRGQYQLRPEANTSSLTQRRKPGRPKKMSKALIVD